MNKSFMWQKLQSEKAGCQDSAPQFEMQAILHAQLCMEANQIPAEFSLLGHPVNTVDLNLLQVNETVSAVDEFLKKSTGIHPVLFVITGRGRNSTKIKQDIILKLLKKGYSVYITHCNK